MYYFKDMINTIQSHGSISLFKPDYIFMEVEPEHSGRIKQNNKTIHSVANISYLEVV